MISKLGLNLPLRRLGGGRSIVSETQERWRLKETASRKPILVTGSHRSGTTWVGRMLAEAPFVHYIHEPFSVSDPPSLGTCGARFTSWFTHITPENQGPFYRPLQRTIGLQYDLMSAFKSVRSFRDLSDVLAEYMDFRRCRRQGSVALIKDPIALFSAEWLASSFDMNVVVMIRHPAAFVSSIKRLNWSHPFSHFLDQPLLMRNLLSPFEPKIREFASRQHELFDQAILLWQITAHAIAEYQRRHSDWIFIRHEDLARDVFRGFRTLFDRLGLELTEHASAVIRQYSSSTNPREARVSIGSDEALKLDSEASIGNWKNRLTSSEIERIRQQVGSLSAGFYSDEDW